MGLRVAHADSGSRAETNHQGQPGLLVWVPQAGRGDDDLDFACCCLGRTLLCGEMRFRSMMVRQGPLEKQVVEKEAEATKEEAALYSSGCGRC